MTRRPSLVNYPQRILKEPTFYRYGEWGLSSVEKAWVWVNYSGF